MGPLFLSLERLPTRASKAVIGSVLEFMNQEDHEVTPRLNPGMSFVVD
jgi:hypothetical protein